MNPLIAILQYKLFNQIYIYHFLLSIAVIGSIYQFAELIKHIRECNYIIHEVKNNGIRIENPDYEIYQTSYINTPIVMGLRGIILIPEDLNKEEIDYALKHEITHIKHKDNLIKFTANLFKILFWWFIPIYIFNKQLDLYLELHADNKAIENLEEHKKLDYLNFLVKTQKQAIKSSTTVLNSNLSFNRKSNLNYRINAILNKKTRSAIFIVPILFIMI
ncbi:MAG: M56 family metallopeptidase, partial [Holdemanella biformis]